MNFSIAVINLMSAFVALLTLSIRCCSTAFNGVTYTFGYAVDEPRLGVISQHWEERREDLVRGGYSFLGSDGRVRVVEYQVEGNRGFRAVVTYRKPTGQQIVDHLMKYPRRYHSPLQLAQPVGIITPDLLYGSRTYPHLNSY